MKADIYKDLVFNYSLFFIFILYYVSTYYYYYYYYYYYNKAAATVLKGIDSSINILSTTLMDISPVTYKESDFLSVTESVEILKKISQDFIHLRSKDAINALIS